MKYKPSSPFYMVAALVAVAAVALLVPYVFAAGTDTDGDLMPDTWETNHGLNPNNPADASQDPDQDGFTNLEEYYMATDPQVADTTLPTAPMETFTYDNLGRVTGVSTNGVVTETFVYDEEGNITSSAAQ